MDDTDYALGRREDEYDRLIEQGVLLRPLTERMLREAGIASGMHVLDVGCGVGDVSLLVSELVGPEGSVAGIDVDGAALRVAERRCLAQNCRNIVFREGDARSVQFDRPFDAAVGRHVLMYMSDPTAALREIGEKVRRGGILAFQEWVAGVSPARALNLPVLGAFQDLVCAAFQRSGADPEIGAALYRHMRDAGLNPEPRPIAEVLVCVNQGPVAFRRWALYARSMLRTILKYDLATEEEVLSTVRGPLEAELTDARGIIPLSWMMIGQWARKPSK
jgi:ubiquinone/menaquinone biosynthesis C-methylase UbiE